MPKPRVNGLETAESGDNNCLDSDQAEVTVRKRKCQEDVGLLSFLQKCEEQWEVEIAKVKNRMLSRLSGQAEDLETNFDSPASKNAKHDCCINDLRSQLANKDVELSELRVKIVHLSKAGKFVHHLNELNDESLKDAKLKELEQRNQALEQQLEDTNASLAKISTQVVGDLEVPTSIHFKINEPPAMSVTLKNVGKCRMAWALFSTPNKSKDCITIQPDIGIIDPDERISVVVKRNFKRVCTPFHMRIEWMNVPVDAVDDEMPKDQWFFSGLFRCKEIEVLVTI